MSSMYLYHYFDKRTGPFKSLTAVSREEAQKVMNQIKEDYPNSQCASRHDKYVDAWRKEKKYVKNTSFA